MPTHYPLALTATALQRTRPTKRELRAQYRAAHGALVDLIKVIQPHAAGWAFMTLPLRHAVKIAVRYRLGRGWPRARLVRCLGIVEETVATLLTLLAVHRDVIARDLDAYIRANARGRVHAQPHGTPSGPGICINGDIRARDLAALVAAGVKVTSVNGDII